ncbi:MAG TPA: BtrH N-terminal domain-containing protein [Ruminiclostridium sp.]|nr:BtrH N-terminal domain-containing protein [Ruminiclostridium sp.]
MTVDNTKPEESVTEMESYLSEFGALRHERVICCNFTGIACRTYAEISRDAFLKYYLEGYMELRNVEFLVPLLPLNENTQEVRTILSKEKDHLKYIISSRAEGNEAGNQWIRHAEGLMCNFKGDKLPPYSLTDLKKRFSKAAKTVSMDIGTGAAGEGTWKCTAHAYSGESGEALIEFKSPAELVEIVKGRVLSHSLIDCVIDTAVRHIAGDGWTPLSCDSLKFYGTVSCRVYAYIREKAAREEGLKEASYKIQLLDENGERLADIENFRIGYGREEKRKKPQPGPVKGYPDAKHGMPVRNVDTEQNSPAHISGMSWRQFDCRDRIIAFLLGQKNVMLINYLKFFVGANRGYNVKKFGFSEQNNLEEDIFLNSMLGRFGYCTNSIEVSGPEDVHTAIAACIDRGAPIAFWMDEYYIFYTQFYLKSHTGHVAAINGYSSEKKLYSIIDHNHLKYNNPSKIIDYGQFYCTYETIENIYSGLDPRIRFIVTLDEMPTKGLQDEEELRKQVKEILYYLADTGQAGNDTMTVFDSVNGEGVFDADTVDKLYLQLGGKELLTDCVLKLLNAEKKQTDTAKELALEIVRQSNRLLDSYITALYRGKNMTRDRAAEYIESIKKDSVRFFREVLNQLE